MKNYKNCSFCPYFNGMFRSSCEKNENIMECYCELNKKPLIVEIEFANKEIDELILSQNPRQYIFQIKGHIINRRLLNKNCIHLNNCLSGRLKGLWLKMMDLI